MTTYNYTGAVQSWTAPADGYVDAALFGAGFPGAMSGLTSVTFRVLAGDVLNLYVGGAPTGSERGWNGGGQGGAGTPPITGGAAGQAGRGGAGATDIRLNGTDYTDRIAVAGGAGGPGGDSGYAPGGTSQPGLTGGVGGGTAGGGAPGGGAGSGGTQTSGNSKYGGGGDGLNGGYYGTTLGPGGGGGGGGGGYWGGKGGAGGLSSGTTTGNPGQGGGGGSGYRAPTVNGEATQGISFTGGGSYSHGSIELNFRPDPPPGPTTALWDGTIEISLAVTIYDGSTEASIDHLEIAP